MRKQLIIALAFALLFSHQALSQQASSINPNVPETDADIDSATIRALALAAYTDITALQNDHNLPTIGADQYLGTTTAGIAGPFSWPACSNSNQALIYVQGVGVRCNTLNFSGLGTVTSVSYQGDGIFTSTTPSTPVTSSGNIGPTVLNQQSFCVFAGPTTGSPGAPSCRALTGNDLPLPATNSIGGVKAIAAVAHQFVTAILNTGQALLAQPSFSDLLGSIAPGQYTAATSSSLGAIQPDNVTCSVSAGILSCAGGGSSVSVTAASDFVTINPSPGTGTFTVDAGKKSKMAAASAIMSNFGGL